MAVRHRLQSGIQLQLATSSFVRIWLVLIIWSLSCIVSAADTTSIGKFVPVKTAQVKMTNGVPRLLINGKPILPIMFFPNTDIPGELSVKYMKAQVALAGESGVHIYSFPYRVSRSENTQEPDYSRGDSFMQTIVNIDPQAVFVLRMYPGPWPFWKEWSEIPADNISKFSDGTSHYISMASEYFWGLSDKHLIGDIRHLESGAFKDRVICYQLGGPEHEMFTDSYREKGPDYSSANAQRFRQWLLITYKTNSALQTAWGRPDITLQTAGIPTFEPGRFPMHGARGGEDIEMFYTVPKEQDWLDFGRYCSDIASDRILDWAKLVKKETKGRKLTAFFYGYTFELCGSFSSHSRLDKVLACPDVDILGSPYSYVGRMGGEPGGFMSPVDSITAHGKLWFNEDDTITSLIDMNKTTLYSSIFYPNQARDLDETIGILDRNFGALLTHRTGTWWMDLAGAGAFKDPKLWRIMEQRSQLLKEVQAHPSPYRPEVAVVVDEYSKSVVKSDWDGFYWPLMQLRNEAMKTGTTVGFYTLDDFINGIVPKCKVYLFPNAYALTSKQSTSVFTRLDMEKTTAIWLYAPGSFGPQGFNTTSIERTTGIAVKSIEGSQGSIGVGSMAGQSWGQNASVSPRFIVDDPKAETLGIYQSDHTTSAARKLVNKHQSIFIGDLSVSSSLLRTLFEKAGAHIWTRGDEIVQTDGQFLIIHQGPEGLVTVNLPVGVKAEAISADIIKQGDSSITLRMQKNATSWLRLRSNGNMKGNL